MAGACATTQLKRYSDGLRWKRLFLRGGEVELLAAGDRTVGERLLPTAGHLHHVVAHEIEHAPHIQVWRSQVLQKRGRERAVGSIAVERDLPLLGGIDHDRARRRLVARKPTADRAR